MVHIFASYEAIIKNPPAIDKFFKKEIICIWSLKSEWNITETIKVNKHIKDAAILVLNPIIKNIGIINSKNNEG